MGGLTAFSAIIWLLVNIFTKELVEGKVLSVNTSYECYYRANYSESDTELSPDGELHTSYDSWHESVSDVLRVYTIDSMVIKSNAEVICGIKCEKPLIYDDIDKGYCFDDITFHERLSIRAELVIEKDTFTQHLSEEEYHIVLRKLNKTYLMEINGFGFVTNFEPKKQGNEN